MEKNIKKDVKATNKPVINKSASKSVQYFTLGKDNCLIHHPTGHIKKSTPSAVFCKTDPFQTKHKKAKSTLPKSSAQHKFTVTTNLHQQAAISKLAKNLKHVNAALSPNSDIFKTIIEGKSLKLNPKLKSCNDTSSYCERIKRCKMCGEVMVGLDPLSSHCDRSCSSSGHLLSHGDRPCSSIDTFSDPVPHNIVHLEEKTKNMPHKHNSRIKRCVICSKFFIQPYGSTFCEDCPGSEISKDSVKFKTKYGAATINRPTSPIPSNVASSTSIGHQANKYFDYKTSQQVNSNNFPEKSNYIKDKVTQPKVNISKPSLKKTTFDTKETFNTKSKVPAQSKSVLKTNGIAAKSRDPSKTISFESNVGKKHSKEANSLRNKPLRSKASIDSIAKALSERCQALSRPENTTEQSKSKSYFNKEPSDEVNLSIAKNVGKVPNKPSIPLSKTKETNLDFQNYFSKGIFNEGQLKNINMRSNQASTKASNMPIQTQAKRGYSPVRASEDLISDSICIDHEACSSINLQNRSSADEINMPKDTQSLPESDLAALESSSERIRTQESQVDEIENNSKSGASTEDIDISSHSNSLPDKSQVIDQSKESSKILTPECLNANKPCSYPTMINKSTSTDKLNGATYGSLSQIEEDLLSKFADMLDQNKDVKSPTLQNVTVNNYYFVSGTDVQKVLCNSSIARGPSDISVVSDNEVKVQANKVTHDKIRKLNVSSLQPELSKSFLEKLSAKYNTKDDLCDSLHSQSIISFYGGATSDLDSDCSKLSQSGISYNLCNEILGRKVWSKNSNSFLHKQRQVPNMDAQSLCSVNPYIQKSLRIFQEMERVRNDPIDQEKILEELKKNKDVMKIIDQMATKKLNFSRKAAVFKNLTSQ